MTNAIRIVAAHWNGHHRHFVLKGYRILLFLLLDTLRAATGDLYILGVLDCHIHLEGYNVGGFQDGRYLFPIVNHDFVVTHNAQSPQQARSNLLSRGILTHHGSRRRGSYRVHGDSGGAAQDTTHNPQRTIFGDGYVALECGKVSVGSSFPGLWLAQGVRVLTWDSDDVTMTSVPNVQHAPKNCRHWSWHPTHNAFMVLVTPAAGAAAEPPLELSPETSKKTKRLETTAHHNQQHQRRLVEYFVVVSSVAKKETEATIQESISFDESTIKSDDGDSEDHVFVDDFDFQPVITARYPLEDHPGNPLHENVTFFCHPLGAIQLRTDQTMPKVRSLVEKTLWLCFALSVQILRAVSTALWARVPRFTTYTLSHALLLSVFLGSLLCRHGGNWKANVRYLPDCLGTLHNYVNSKRGKVGRETQGQEEGSLSPQMLGAIVNLPVFDGLSRIPGAAQPHVQDGRNVVAVGTLHSQLLFRDSCPRAGRL